MSQHAQAAFAALVAQADPVHEESHKATAHAIMASAPPQAKAGIGDIIHRGLGAGLPWGKILAAIMIAAAGGFTPAAIAAAIASLFPTPALP